MITTATRHKAFVEIKSKKQIRYKQILERLDKPKTAKELAVELYIDRLIPSTERNYTAPRLTELDHMGLVHVVDKKRCQYTGKKVAVYRKSDGMKYKELKGLCKDCAFKCGRVENPLFEGVYQCEYATIEQITIDKYLKNAEQLSIDDLHNMKGENK